MANNIRLIATDLDGTFFDSHGQVIPANIEAFRDANAAGIAIAISSGRCVTDIRYVHDTIGLKTWIIGFNGAIVCAPDSDEGIFSKPIDRALLEKMLTFLEDELDIYYHISCVGVRYVLARGRHLPDAERTRIGLSAHGIRIEFINTWREAPDEILNSCMKVIASTRIPEEAARLQEEAPKLGLPLTITSSWWNNIEVVAEGVDKGEGIRKLCEHLGITTDQVMVLGDQMNDYAMFAVAGWPVAMGNGDDRIKVAARIVSGTNDEAGVAQAVRRYALGESEEEVAAKIGQFTIQAGDAEAF